jgi:hypothetical protein
MIGLISGCIVGLIVVLNWEENVGLMTGQKLMLIPLPTPVPQHPFLVVLVEEELLSMFVENSFVLIPSNVLILP